MKVHRSGRTGRAGKEGTAITFITPSEYRKLAFIKRVAKADIRKERPPKVRDIIRAKKNRIIADVKAIIEKEDLAELEGLAQGIMEGVEPTLAVQALVKYAFQKELDRDNYNDIRTIDRDSRHDRGDRGDRRDHRDRRHLPSYLCTQQQCF